MTTPNSAATDASSRYEIFYDHPACKVLDRLSQAQYEPIDEKIVGLSLNPRPHGYKQLHPRLYRVRVGDWRIIYVVDDDTKRVIIADVRRRGKDTYKSL